jgi:hypothetical protein
MQELKRPEIQGSHPCLTQVDFSVDVPATSIHRDQDQYADVPDGNGLEKLMISSLLKRSRRIETPNEFLKTVS